MRSGHGSRPSGKSSQVCLAVLCCTLLKLRKNRIPNDGSGLRSLYPFPHQLEPGVFVAGTKLPFLDSRRPGDVAYLSRTEDNVIAISKQHKGFPSCALGAHIANTVDWFSSVAKRAAEPLRDNLRRHIVDMLRTVRRYFCGQTLDEPMQEFERISIYVARIGLLLEESHPLRKSRQIKNRCLAHRTERPHRNAHSGVVVDFGYCRLAFVAAVEHYNACRAHPVRPRCTLDRRRSEVIRRTQ